MYQEEVTLIIGRRGGKSFISAVISIYLAAFKNWKEELGPGETGYIMLLATDKKQAGVVFNYMWEILGIPEKSILKPNGWFLVSVMKS